MRLVFGDEFPIIAPVQPQLKMAPEEENVEISDEPGSITEGEAEPRKYLGKNYPDPFTNMTHIPYLVPLDAEKALIKVHDIKG
ncbi:MAG: hypothetical protein IH910_07135, partial [Proteobacteria bacterium]|nr:hypothetical protein [Pseudomonadota bacterium]